MEDLFLLIYVRHFSLSSSKANDVFSPSSVCNGSCGTTRFEGPGFELPRPPGWICHSVCHPLGWQKRVMWALCASGMLCMSHDDGLKNIFLCICRYTMPRRHIQSCLIDGNILWRGGAC